MTEHQTSTNRERAVAQFEFHPFADVFHLLDGREFDELVTDIRTHGQREPIVLHEGKILDGRNRFLAGRAAGSDHGRVYRRRPAGLRDLGEYHAAPSDYATAGGNRGGTRHNEVGRPD
jgi:hypothetical protein